MDALSDVAYGATISFERCRSRTTYRLSAKRANTCLLALPSIGHSPKKKCCLLGTTARNCWRKLLLIRAEQDEKCQDVKYTYSAIALNNGAQAYLVKSHTSGDELDNPIWPRFESIFQSIPSSLVYSALIDVLLKSWISVEK
jgi:hypothetical protein